jgi:hypothetical protein
MQMTFLNNVRKVGRLVLTRTCFSIVWNIKKCIISPTHDFYTLQHLVNFCKHVKENFYWLTGPKRFVPRAVRCTCLF